MTDKDRRDKLYHYLIGKGDTWTTQAEIGQIFPDAYGVTGGKDFHSTVARRRMSADIRHINMSDEYEKPIISGSYGVKIANEAEINSYISRESAEAIRKLSLVSTIKLKAMRSGQIDLDGKAPDAFIGG